jgi:hypothetical protein
MERDWVDPIIELLGNDSSQGEARSVCFQDEAFGPIRSSKDWRFSTDLF